MTDEQYEALVQKYLEDFRKEITEDILQEGVIFFEDEEMRYRYYLGSMPWPSGKMYAPWSHANEEENLRDLAWFTALEKRCNELVKEIPTLSYMSFEHGEGDPCDLFLVWGVVADESEKKKNGYELAREIILHKAFTS